MNFSVDFGIAVHFTSVTLILLWEFLGFVAFLMDIDCDYEIMALMIFECEMAMLLCSTWGYMVYCLW